MANKPSPNTVLNTLQRGKACLRCRKRKMRCDGVKPACQQCTRAKKAEGCEYDDGKGKTRTQLMREHIAHLEQRIRDLEDPDHIAPAVVLHQPHVHQYSGSSSSSLVGSPEGKHFYAHSPFTSDSGNSPQDCWAQLPLVTSPSPTPFTDLFRFEEPTTFETSQMLLEIFSARRSQCGLEINIARLAESLTLPVSEQRHPALMNAIFLWSCFVSRPGPLCQHESHYLARTLESLADSLHHADKVVDIVQASCLLSLYFLSNGRMLEGAYHAGAAASLATQFGLERNDCQQSAFEPLHAFKIDSAKDSIEENERISAFWQAYNLDYCWSVVLRKPPVIRDGRYAFTSPSDDYEKVDGCLQFQNIHLFMEAPAVPVSPSQSMLALRVKASALFQRADRLSSSWDSRVPPSNTLKEDIQALENAISRLQATLIPPHQFDSIPCDKHALTVIHTLTHAAMVILYSRFAQEDPISYDKCLRSARSIVTIIKHVAEPDLAFLDPIVGACWTSAADVLIREMDAMEASWPLIDSTTVRNEIGTILYALTSLSAQFSLFGYFAARIQERPAEQ